MPHGHRFRRGGIAAFAGPGSPLNKVTGLGFGEPVEGIEVADSGTDELPAWIDLFITGFASPDAQGVPIHESFPRDELERVIADMAHTEGLVRYFARQDGTPIGGATMRTLDGVAQLCGAATLVREP